MWHDFVIRLEINCTEVLGFQVSQFLSTAKYDEYILEAEEGSALVLMHWTDGMPRNYHNNPVKLELGIEPIGHVWLNIFKAGGAIPGKPLAMAKDLDGTMLEVRRGKAIGRFK